MLIPLNKLFEKYQIHRPEVLHLGANEGQEANVYHQCKAKRVIWVEALPFVFEKLQRNIAAYPNQHALLACVSDKDGESVQFNIASNEGQSSSFLEFGTHRIEHPTVRWTGRTTLTTVRVDTLLRSRGWEPTGFNWFLNADLQGAELLAMKGMGDMLKCFRYAYIEVNAKELYQGCPLVGEIDAFLASFGFEPKQCEMTGNGWGDKFYIRPIA